MATAGVARISTTPVKSLGLSHPDRIELSARGVADDRRFYLLDADDRLVGGVKHGPLVQVAPAWDGSRLTLVFPDGVRIEAEVELGEPVETDFYGKRTVYGRRVIGPWADALSDFRSANLSLARVEDVSHAQDIHIATLVSDGSLAAIGGLDGRRFRMLLELEGCHAFEEDEWDGELVRAGAALLRVAGPVPRCAVTTQDPALGIRDHDTLRVIRALRGTTEQKDIYFGMYATVVEPGVVAVGDVVTPTG